MQQRALQLLEPCKSCAILLRSVSIPLGTRSPVQASIPGGYVAAVRQRRRPTSRALGRDQWQPMRDRHHHRRCLRRSRICIYHSDFYYFTRFMYAFNSPSLQRRGARVTQVTASKASLH